MSPILIIIGILALLICTWWVSLYVIRQRLCKLAMELRECARRAGEDLIIEPQSCVYRGANREFGNIKGNGVIALTEKRIMFKKLTGEQINMDRSRITKVSIENTFKGETNLATKGSHLIIETKDGNRIGFLIKNDKNWVEQFDSQQRTWQLKKERESKN